MYNISAFERYRQDLQKQMDKVKKQLRSYLCVVANALYKVRFNALYTLLYVWCDFKAQTLIINTDPFSSFLSEGKLI